MEDIEDVESVDLELADEAKSISILHFSFSNCLVRSDSFDPSENEISDCALSHSVDILFLEK